MSNCVDITKWDEAYKELKSKLLDRESQGYDVTEAMEELETINNSQKDKMKLVEEAKGKIEWLDDSEVVKANKYGPFVNKKKVTILSIGKDAAGNLRYIVDYGNGRKYTRYPHEVIFDNADSRYNEWGLGSIADTIKDKKAKYEELAYDIWNDNTKAVELFDDLLQYDKVDPEHADDLRELVKTMTDPAKEIMNQFKVMLNKKASMNKGFAVIYDGKSKSRIELDIAESTGSKQWMSAAEVYAHELVHLSIETAKLFRTGDIANVISDLNKLWNSAADVITIEKMVAKGMPQAQAEATWKYIFENTNGNGLSEFIAYGMTNQIMKELLAEVKKDLSIAKNKREGMWGLILNGLISIYEEFRKILNLKADATGGDARLGQLVTKMWEHNNISSKKAGMLASILDVGKVINTVDENLLKSGRYLGGKLNDTIDGIIDVLPDGESKNNIKKTKLFFKHVNPIVTGENAKMRDKVIAELRHDFKGGMLAGLLDPNGITIGLLNNLSENDMETERVENRTLLAGQIDTNRHDTTISIAGDVLQELGNPNKQEQEMLTRVVLKADLKALIGKYDNEQRNKLVTDDEYREKEIAKLEAEVKNLRGNEDISNYYIAQAKGLAIFMNTGKSGRTLNKNASDIATANGAVQVLVDAGIKIEDKWKNKDSKEVKDIEEVIDALATLYAVDGLDKNDRVDYGKMVDTVPKGLDKLIRYATLHERDSDRFLADNQFWDRKVKGAIKDISADYKGSRVHSSNLKGKKEMKNLGYKFIGETNVAGMGLYTKNTPDLAEFTNQAFVKINIFNRQHSISSALLSADKLKASKEDLDDWVASISDMEIDGLDVGQDIIMQTEGNMPNLDGYNMVIDRFGNLVDYAASVDNVMYQEAMKTETGAPLVIGKMVSEIQEKMASVIKNNETLIELYSQMTKYKVRGEVNDGHDWIELGPDAKYKSKYEKRRAESLWNDLPQYIKAKIKSRSNGARYVAVRNDLANKFIGYRAPSILDGRIPFTDTNLSKILTEHEMGQVVELFKIIGVVWDEIAGFIKNSIVVRMPEVIWQNIQSNLQYATFLGQTPLEVLNDTIDLFKATKEYLDMKREVVRIENQYRAGITRSEKDRAKYFRYKEAMKNSPVAKTMEAGLFTAKLEDISMKELEAKGMLEQMFSGLLDKIPTIIRDGFSALWISTGSPIYTIMLTMVQYSDFVFRTGRYNYLIKKGVDPINALAIVKGEAINYPNELPTVLRWLDKKVIFPFSKYSVGITKNLLIKARTNPSMLIAMSLTGGVNPTDGFLLNKDYDAAINSPLEILSKGFQYTTEPALLRGLGAI